MKPKILVGIIDHLKPSVQAMIIAKYSRSYDDVETWLPKTPEEEQSLADRTRTYYVNYKHKSVGQLGHTSIFFQGVSQLVAKAVEDDPLFNGQESSTRYIDFSTQHFYAPKTNDYLGGAIIDIQEELRALYVDAMPLLTERLKNDYLFDVDSINESMTSEQISKKHETYNNTIKARAFDIARCILPAGAVTNVALCGTFDMINDKLGSLLHHPLAEVREIAWTALEGLQATYPEATAGPAALKEQFSYMAGATAYFYHPSGPYHQLDTIMDSGALWQHGWMENRKKWQLLPRSVSAQQRFRLGGKLDFGAFRDLHRHRNGDCMMPLLTTELGVHEWFLKELGPALGFRLLAIVDKISKLRASFPNIEANKMIIDLQYAVPMGCKVWIQYDCGLNQLAYLTELRTGKTVHQTLRHYMQDSYRVLQERRPLIAKGIFPDMDEDNFTLKRGTQATVGV